VTFVRKWRWHILGGGAVALVVAQVLLRGTTFFPESGEADVASSVNDFQSWVRDNRDTNWFLHGLLRPIGDFVLSCYEGLRDLLLGLPWFWLPLLVLLVILRSGRWLTAVVVSAGLAYVEVAGLHREAWRPWR
jgi:hypothetical protein